MKKYILLVPILMFMLLGGGYTFAATDGRCAKTSCTCIKGGCCLNGKCACNGNCCVKGQLPLR